MRRRDQRPTMVAGFHGAPAPAMAAAHSAVAARALAGLSGYDSVLSSDSLADGRGAEQIINVLRERPSD